MSSPRHTLQPTPRPGFAFVHAALQVRQGHTDILGELGLLPHQHAILSSLENLGPAHQRKLANRIDVDQGDMVAHLDGLQRDGYIVRERDPGDRRRRIVSITDAGRALLVECDRALDGVEEGIFSTLNEQDRDELLRISTALYLAGRPGTPDSGDTDPEAIPTP